MMIEFYRDDPARIQHFIKVHSFAKLIGEEEHLDEKLLYILEAAAYVDDIEANSSVTYGADGLLNDVKGFYVRKRSDDRDVNAIARYVYDEKSGGFTRSAAPYMEIRYAEVLLNYAEAACNAGEMGVAVDQLQKIRARVGYKAENNYGLEAGLDGDQAKCMAAIMYERQI